MRNFDVAVMLDKMVAAKRTPEDLKKNPPLIHVVITDPKGKGPRKVISVPVTRESFPK